MLAGCTPTGQGLSRTLGVWPQGMRPWVHSRGYLNWRWGLRQWELAGLHAGLELECSWRAWRRGGFACGLALAPQYFGAGEAGRGRGRCSASLPAAQADEAPSPLRSIRRGSRSAGGAMQAGGGLALRATSSFPRDAPRLRGRPERRAGLAATRWYPGGCVAWGQSFEDAAVLEAVRRGASPVAWRQR